MMSVVVKTLIDISTGSKIWLCLFCILKCSGWRHLNFDFIFWRPFISHLKGFFSLGERSSKPKKMSGCLQLEHSRSLQPGWLTTYTNACFECTSHRLISALNKNVFLRHICSPYLLHFPHNPTGFWKWAMENTLTGEHIFKRSTGLDIRERNQAFSILLHEGTAANISGSLANRS